MDKAAFLRRLAEILEVSPPEVTETLPLTGENWDSLAVLATIALIDEQLGLSLPARDLETCGSVGQLLETVTRAAEDASASR